MSTVDKYDAIKALTDRVDTNPGYGTLPSPDPEDASRVVEIPYGALGSDVASEEGSDSAEPNLAFTVMVIDGKYYTPHSYTLPDGSQSGIIPIPIYGNAIQLIERYIEGLDVGIVPSINEGWL